MSRSLIVIRRIQQRENGTAKEAAAERPSVFVLSSVEESRRLMRFAFEICLSIGWLLLLGGVCAGTQSPPQQHNASYYYQQAERYFREKNLDQARLAASHALQLSPRMAEAANLLGLIAGVSGRLAEAEGYFKRAVSSRPDYGPGHLNLAQAYLKQDKPDLAKPELETVVRLDPSNGTAQYLLGAMLLKADDPHRAIGHFEAALRANPRNYQGLMSLLTCQLALGQQAEAKQSAEKINLLLGPRDPRLLQLGVLLADRGAYVLAIPVFRRVLEETPGSYEAAYNLVLAFFLTDDTQQAEAALKRLLVQHDEAELHDLLGEVYEKRERYREAGPEFQKAATMEPGNEDYRFNYGLVLIEFGAFHPAVEVLTQATKDFPNSGRMWSALGAAEFVWGAYDLALQHTLHSTDLDPDLSWSYYCLGRLYIKVSAESQKRVMEKLKSYLAQHPNDPWAHYFYGAGLFQEQQELGARDYTSVESHLRKAIELQSDLAEAHFELGLVLSAQGKNADAVPELLQACKLDPQMPEAHYRLGLAYAKLGEKAKAEKELRLQQRLHAESEEERRKEFVQAVPQIKNAGGVGKR
jgi:tetratricopeptide (TPR) repeat protein